MEGMRQPTNSTLGVEITVNYHPDKSRG